MQARFHDRPPASSQIFERHAGRARGRLANQRSVAETTRRVSRGPRSRMSVLVSSGRACRSATESTASGRKPTSCKQVTVIRHRRRRVLQHPPQRDDLPGADDGRRVELSPGEFVAQARPPADLRAGPRADGSDGGWRNRVVPSVGGLVVGGVRRRRRESDPGRRPGRRP